MILPRRVPYYQVDAFTDRLFAGNPAGVCILDEKLEDNILLDIAAENRHSETAFLLTKKKPFNLRWFTPTKEVDLCGHATLAAAYILFAELGHADSRIEFESAKSGLLFADWDFTNQTVMLDFPARPGTPHEAPPALVQGLGRSPRKVLKNRDYLAVFDTADEVDSLKPDFESLRDVDECLGIIVTSKAGKNSGADFVSRFFEPRSGFFEDPVTGSAHCTLIPYWANQLGKTQMIAKQRSIRGGTIFCEMRQGGRVGIGGHAVLYSRGELILPH